MPVRCGEAIGYTGLNQFFKPKSTWIASEINGAVLVSPKNHKVGIDFKSETGYILNRRIFDYDISLMGVGSNILGYANNQVDNAVKRAISNSNISTLNCPEEVELCEKLLELHPWADMARFSRSGGEACSIAIRIARASSGKDKVLFWCQKYILLNQFI